MRDADALDELANMLHPARRDADRLNSGGLLDDAGDHPGAAERCAA
jgi:hypothetical protein